MALTVQPILAGSNFRTFRERFNAIVGYVNSSLQDDKHLSDLKDIPASRATLKVFSKTESDERYLNEASNLDDLPNKETSRVNLHVWSRDQADARFFEESKLFSEIAGGSNAAKRRTAANNLDMYIKSDLYTRTMGNERYFETTNGNISLSAINSIFADYKKGGTWNVENQNVIGGFDKYGTLLHFTPNGQNRVQFYAPKQSTTKDQLTNASVTESGLAIRTGRGTNSEAWTRLLTTQIGKHMFFEKSRLFDELTGSARQANRETAQNNLDVYNKATSDSRYFEESKNFNELAGGANASRRRSAANNLDMYLKSDVYTQSAARDMFYQMSSGTSVPDTDIKDQKRGGSYEMTDTGPVGYKFGTLSNLSAGAGRLQLYAPHFEYHYDALTAVRTENAALWLRSGWNNDIKTWERVVTQTLGDNRYFKKANKFSELSGSARTSDRETAQSNLDVYKKADVRTKTELDQRFFQKTETYNRSQMDSRYLNEDSNLGDLSDKVVARTNLEVYSKTESNNRYTEHGSEHVVGGGVMFGRQAGRPRIKGAMNELQFVHNHTSADMHVNYIAAPSGYKSPNRWYWRAGSNTTWAAFDIGTTNIHGTLTTTDTIQVPSGKHVKIGTDFLTTRTWTGSQYHTKTVSDGRFLRRTNLNDMFFELKGAALSTTQRNTMLNNLGVYSKAEIDAEFNTGATTYLSKGSNLSDVPNKSQGLAALVELSGSGFTNARNAIRAGFRIIANDRKYYDGTTNGTVGVASGDHQHYTILVRDGGDTTTFNGRRYVMKPNDYESSYGRSVYYDFKLGSVIGSPDTGWNYVNTIAGYSDVSGGRAHQVSYGANGRMYHRAGMSSSTWSDFETIAYLSDKVADSTLFDGKTLSWVRNFNNLTNKPNFGDLYISRKSATNVTGTPVFQNATAGLVIGGGAAFGDADSHFYHGGYSSDAAPGYSARHTYTGSESGTNNAYELWMTNSKATKSQQTKVWRIQQDGILRLSQDMTGKSANFNGSVTALTGASVSNLFGSNSNDSTMQIRAGTNKSCSLYLAEGQNLHAMYIHHNGVLDYGSIGMRYNNVNKEYMRFHLNSGNVDFKYQPTWNGDKLARLKDKVADSDRLDNLNSSQFLRSDADDTISAWLKVTTNKGLQHISGKTLLKSRSDKHLEVSADSADILLGFENTSKVRLYASLYNNAATTKIADHLTGQLFDKGTSLESKYARRNGEAAYDFTGRNFTTTSVSATGDIAGKTLKQDGIKLDDRFMRFDYAGNASYPRMLPAKSGWFRVGDTSGGGGLLPYANGKSYIGTNDWRFKEIHVVNLFENGTKLTDKYAYKAGHSSQNFAAKDLTVQKVNATVEVKAKKVVIDTTIEIKKNSDGSIGFYL